MSFLGGVGDSGMLSAVSGLLKRLKEDLDGQYADD
jgi:hypothetical protein